VLARQYAPPRFSSAGAPDGDFDGAVPDPEVIADAWRAWREEVAFADAYTAVINAVIATTSSLMLVYGGGQEQQAQPGSHAAQWPA
jgi:hypothetical protein